MNALLPDELEELERLQQLQAIRQAELGGVKYAIFTAVQGIAGHRMYPETDEIRREEASQRRQLETLTRREAALSTELADISRRITQLRDKVEVNR